MDISEQAKEVAYLPKIDPPLANKPTYSITVKKDTPILIYNIKGSSSKSLLMLNFSHLIL